MNKGWRILKVNDIIYISIFNLNGRLIDNLFSGNQSAGNYSISWEPRQELSSGLYIGQLKYNDQIFIKKTIKEVIND